MTAAEITARYGAGVARGIRARGFRTHDNPKPAHTPPWMLRKVKGQTWGSCLLAAAAHVDAVFSPPWR